MNITYPEENGYVIPNAVVDTHPIGKYGWMSKKVFERASPGFVQDHGPELSTLNSQLLCLFKVFLKYATE